MDVKFQPMLQRNIRLEELLKEINNLLGPIQKNINTGYSSPKYPIVFIVGAPRSGTTILLQWLAKTGQFSYPTNILSRFYASPYIGAKIQLLLTDPEYNFYNEIMDFNHDISFESNLGKTHGALSPNEFWYFWRRFIPNTEPRYLNMEEINSINGNAFARELASIESVFNKPLALKGIIMQYNISTLSSFFKKAFFLYIKREPFYNMQSLLEARIKYYGNRDAWYSVKPREYDKLKNMNCFEQVAGQVYYTNCSIENEISQIEKNRSLAINYEEFCSNPTGIYNYIVNKLASQACEIDPTYTGPPQLNNTNHNRLSEEDTKLIIRGYERITGKRLQENDFL
ncbi:MAG: sulfotransferase [bacterium]